MRLAATALVLGYYAALGWLLGGSTGLVLGCVPAAVVLGVIEPALRVVSGPVSPRPRRRSLPRR
jgi:hypothetical protein